MSTKPARDILTEAYEQLGAAICISRVAVHAINAAEDDGEFNELACSARSALETALVMFDKASNDIDRAMSIISRAGARPDPRVVKLMREREGVAS